MTVTLDLTTIARFMVSIYGEKEAAEALREHYNLTDAQITNLMRSLKAREN